MTAKPFALLLGSFLIFFAVHAQADFDPIAELSRKHPLQARLAQALGTKGCELSRKNYAAAEQVSDVQVSGLRDLSAEVSKKKYFSLEKNIFNATEDVLVIDVMSPDLKARVTIEAISEGIFYLTIEDVTQVSAILTFRLLFKKCEADFYAIASSSGLTLELFPEPVGLIPRQPLNELIGKISDADPRGKVKIAVVDSTVAVSNDRLNRFLDRDPDGRLRRIDLFQPADSPQYEEDTHGTAVAAIAAGENPDIAIIPVTSCDSNILSAGPGSNYWPKLTPLYFDAIARLNDLQEKSVEQAVTLGARVINMSFGGLYRNSSDLGGGIKSSPTKSLDGYRSAIRNNRATLFTVGSGNDGVSLDEFAVLPASDSGTNENQITVGSYYVFDQHEKISRFSNYSKTLVDLLAPGEKIRTLTTRNREDEFTGTSFAAPKIAHIAAELLLIDPRLSPAEIKSILCKTARRTKDTKNFVRCGIVDEEKAMRIVSKRARGRK
ncbi:MAG: S8 family serine peptidase [Deltaproteobacteria bacterium]|nr:S8 family serine peptidase [Deltaproteobacteria bacterium]